MFPRFAPITTTIPKDSPAYQRKMKENLAQDEKLFANDPETLRSLREFYARGGPMNFIADGPVSFSGGTSFVRPQIERLEPLAQELGLDRAGGWNDVWRQMLVSEQTKKRMVDLVPYELEWANEANAGNTFTYCFLTKYLPRIISAALEEPSPSVFASPYDYLLRGASSTPLLLFYLRSRPDLAIRLRDLYVRKALAIVDLNLSSADLITHLFPLFLVLHTSVDAYVHSPISTPAQKSPPMPVNRATASGIEPFVNLIGITLANAQASYKWAGSPISGWNVLIMTLRGVDIATAASHLVGEQGNPCEPIDWLMCAEGTIEGCRERDPKKLKVCSRCKVVYYCCPEHQTRDWKQGNHKPMCQKILWHDFL